MKKNEFTADMPLVSIGIPTFNRPASLKNSIESVINQTYKNLEIIVSDNCSPGAETEKVVREFQKKDKRIKYFRQKENIGPIGNFQNALDLSTGVYFKWMADDDTIPADYVERCVVFLLKNPDYVLASGFASFYNDDGKFVRDDELLFLESGNEFVRVKKYFINVSSNSVFYGLYSGNALRGIQLTHELGTDWIVILQMLFKGKVKVFDDLYIRRHFVDNNRDSLWDSYKKIFNIRFKKLFEKYPLLSLHLSIIWLILLGRIFKCSFWKRLVLAEDLLINIVYEDYRLYHKVSSFVSGYYKHSRNFKKKFYSFIDEKSVFYIWKMPEK